MEVVYVLCVMADESREEIYKWGSIVTIMY